MKLIIVTGLSGSGKSVTLHTLEDLGYYCIDNLPLFLLPHLAQELAKESDKRFKLTAVGIDARSQPSRFSGITSLLPLKEEGIHYEIIFLEAKEEALIRRFSETKRKHPLSDEERPLADAIKLEHQLLEPLLIASNLRIDTTHTNVHQLRDLIRNRISTHSRKEISLLFQSFGYKQGVPSDADFVFDVRCLPNPHWEPKLRPLTGRDPEVIRFLKSDQRVQDLKDEITQFLERWIPCFLEDGRNYLTVAIGCTGGQHRSVYLVEKLAAYFQHSGRRTAIRHRELP